MDYAALARRAVLSGLWAQLATGMPQQRFGSRLGEVGGGSFLDSTSFAGYSFAQWIDPSPAL